MAGLGAMAVDYDGYPTFLRSKVSLSSAGQQKPKIEQLRNPNSQQALEIHAVRFIVESPVEVRGAAVKVALNLGKVAITNNFVPMWCFGPSHLPWTGEQHFGANYVANESVWRLANPLYVPPGGVLEPTFDYAPYTEAGVDVSIIYEGRILSALRGRDAVVPVPYVTAYTSPMVEGAVVQDMQSSEVDLANVTGKPVIVHRLVGHVATVCFENGQLCNDSMEMGEAAVRNLFIRIEGGRTAPLTKKLTPFRALFPAATKTIETNVMLPPGGFYSVFVRKTALSPAAPAGLDPQIAIHIGLVGSREATVKELTP